MGEKIIPGYNRIISKDQDYLDIVQKFRQISYRLEASVNNQNKLLHGETRNPSLEQKQTTQGHFLEEQQEILDNFVGIYFNNSLTLIQKIKQFAENYKKYKIQQLLKRNSEFLKSESKSAFGEIIGKLILTGQIFAILTSIFFLFDFQFFQIFSLWIFQDIEKDISIYYILALLIQTGKHVLLQLKKIRNQYNQNEKKLWIIFLKNQDQKILNWIGNFRIHQIYPRDIQRIIVTSSRKEFIKLTGKFSNPIFCDPFVQKTKIFGYITQYDLVSLQYQRKSCWQGKKLILFILLLLLILSSKILSVVIPECLGYEEYELIFAFANGIINWVLIGIFKLCTQIFKVARQGQTISNYYLKEALYTLSLELIAPFTDIILIIILQVQQQRRIALGLLIGLLIPLFLNVLEQLFVIFALKCCDNIKKWPILKQLFDYKMHFELPIIFRGYITSLIFLQINQCGPILSSLILALYYFLVEKRLDYGYNIFEYEIDVVNLFKNLIPTLLFIQALFTLIIKLRYAGHFGGYAAFFILGFLSTMILYILSYREHQQEQKNTKIQETTPNNL